MILEALKYLVEMGAKTQTPAKIELPGDKVGIVINGELTEYATNPRNSKGAVGSLESLIDWCTQDGYDEVGVEIYVRPGSILVDVAPLSIANLRQCTLDLKPSKAALFLHAWAAESLPQKTIVRGLRGPLDGCFDPAHLAAFRSLDFARRSDGTRTIEHGKESMGRSIEAMAQSRSGSIPEAMAFDVPIFALNFAGNVQRIRFAVEVDAESERIGIVPVGDCVDEAKMQAREAIVALLKERINDAEVYLGE